MKTPSNLPKRRNPLAVLARRRRAGRHGPSAAALRQHAARALVRELDAMKSSVP